MTMMTMDQANAYAAGRNFDNMAHLKGTTYQDVSTVVILPSRGMMHQRAAQAIFNVQGPMNAKRAVLTCEGHEVGHAYNAMIDTILAHPDLGKWRYVLTIEDDNLPPPDAHIRLIESIEAGPFDAVGALYFTKGEGGMPMCYGDPSQLAPMCFRPRDVRAAVERGHIVECNGIAMGCTLYRMDLFRDIKGPWFVTTQDSVHGHMTQDLYFCQRARAAGKRFAVDCRVKVGHLDINTGIVW